MTLELSATSEPKPKPQPRPQPKPSRPTPYTPNPNPRSYVPVIIFYLLTLLETADFIKDDSLTYHWWARIAIAIFMMAEMVMVEVTRQATVDGVLGICPVSLESNAPLAHIMQALILVMLIIRFLGTTITVMLFLVARISKACRNKAKKQKEAQKRHSSSAVEPA